MALIRQSPEDFQVFELPAFEPAGTGEHVLLGVEKRGANTDWVADELARFCGLARRDVSYAGRKDRNALTVQRFSLHMPGQASPDFSQFDCPGVRVLSMERHDRKLRRGALAGNRFQITLRELDEAGLQIIEQRLPAMIEQGFPNYFGSQRFGRDGRNWQQAQRWLIHKAFKPRRNQREMLLSAARSAFFNAALSQRIEQGDWLAVQSGDTLQLAGSQSIFVADDSADLDQRVRTGDLSPALALPGGDSPATAFAGVDPDTQEAWRAALHRERLDASWRAARVIPAELSAQRGPAPGSLVLEFCLPPGCFATALLDELVDCREAAPD